MKRVTQALCPRCGFVLNTATKLVVEKKLSCPDCGVVMIERVNNQVEGGKRP